MKRVLSVILSIVMIFSSLGVFSASASVSITLEYGDVNGSGKINNKDLGVLMQYLNDWEVDGFFASVADVNVDGNVNNKDYGLLMQYINEWDVKLGVQSGGTVNPGNIINNGVNAEDYRGRTIKFASTIDPALDESGPVIANFESEYSINVEIINCTHENYAAEMAGLIASGNAPDVVRSNGDFPLFLSYTQPLDAAKLDYDEEIWNQNTFKLTTFNGSPYLCDTVGNIWSEIDIVMYSKSLLKRANAYTPEEYDAMGKWTWDAFFAIARAVSNLGDDYIGGSVPAEIALHSSGASVYKIKDGKIVNGIDNAATLMMAKFATAWKEGILGYSTIPGFLNGNYGIIATHAWSLKKTGDLKNYNWNDIGFYYLPSFDEETPATPTGILRGWGIAMGARQPIAAGIFLREYLDVNNYDVGGTFISPAAERFFFEVTNIDYSNYNPNLTYIGHNEIISGIDYMSDVYRPMYYEPSQVASSMAAVKATVDKGTANMNKYIEQYTGLR